MKEPCPLTTTVRRTVSIVEQVEVEVSKNIPKFNEVDIKILGVTNGKAERERKGSTCKTLRPLPTFVKVESQSSTDGQERCYVRKEDRSKEEEEWNNKMMEDVMMELFPEEKMKDKFYRDKDKETAIRSWILQLLEDKEDENNKTKRKSSNVQEPEELNFLLKSGIVLCKLITKLYPQSTIDIDKLQVQINGPSFIYN